MAAKSSPNRKVAPKSATQRRPRVEQSEVDEFDEDIEGDDQGYVTGAVTHAADYAREHQGRVVITALVAGFSIGLFLGGLLAHSKQKEASWTDRLAMNDLGHRLKDRVTGMMPSNIAQRLGRG